MKIEIELPDDLKGVEQMKFAADSTAVLFSKDAEKKLKEHKITVLVENACVYQDPYGKDEGSFKIYVIYGS